MTTEKLERCVHKPRNTWGYQDLEETGRIPSSPIPPASSEPLQGERGSDQTPQQRSQPPKIDVQKKDLGFLKC